LKTIVRKEIVTTRSSGCSKDDKIRGLLRTEYSSNETEYGKAEGSDGDIRVKYENDDTKNGEGRKEILRECEGDCKV
jgi:hypothetical protein